METVDFIWMIAAFFLTLLVFSYLFGDNFLFRIVTYIFVGVTAGFAFVMAIYQVIIPRLITPLVSGMAGERILALFPLTMGVLLLAKLSPRFSNIGNLPMAYLVGIGAAVAVGGAVLGTIVPQVGATWNVFNTRSPAGSPADALPFGRILEAGLILLGSATSLAYFHFSARKPDEGGGRPVWMETAAQIGQVFIGATLGAIFAGVFLSSITALVDRLSFLRDVILLLISGD